MIKKLRLKFIITIMVLVTVVLLVALSVMYFNSVKDLEQQSIDAMEYFAQNNKTELNGFLKPDAPEKPKYAYLSSCIIDIDIRNNTYSISGFDNMDELTDDENAYVNQLIKSVVSKPSNTGVLEEYNFRYYFTSTPRGIRLVLLDKGYEDENLRQLLISLSIGGIISFISFLAISIVIAWIATKPVEKSLKQQRQLVADVSHELKTPITIISTNADIILSRSESTVADERKWLNYIKDETNRMTDMINMMLYLARSDESKEKIVMDTFDISNAAYEVALPFESVCFENNKEFIINIQPDQYIKGNEATIKQLMLILLDNAVKYSNENGRIEISLKNISDKIEISVFNTGKPIPKESIPYLFDRFYRVDESRSREQGGSGLGLSIAKQIIENNEGIISITSDEEHGTVFTCCFSASKHKK